MHVYIYVDPSLSHGHDTKASARLAKGSDERSSLKAEIECMSYRFVCVCMCACVCVHVCIYVSDFEPRPRHEGQREA